LVALLLIGFGLLEVINPRITWYLSEGWKFKDAEPSDLYLAVSRVVGAVLVLIGLGVLVLT